MPASVQTKDLVKLEKALKLFAVRLPEAGQQELKDTTELIDRAATSLVSQRPGSRGSYKREPTAYGHTIRNREPAVEIARGFTAIAAEYGANFHTVFGNRVPAKSMKRRVFGARVKRWKSGKVVGKLIVTDLPKAERRLAKAFDKEAERTFTRMGL